MKAAEFFISKNLKSKSLKMKTSWTWLLKGEKANPFYMKSCNVQPENVLDFLYFDRIKKLDFQIIRNTTLRMLKG